MSQSNEASMNPVYIRAIEIVGEERSEAGMMFGADVHMSTTDGHEWLVNVVTKTRYHHEKSKKGDNGELNADAAAELHGYEQKEPFVVNNRELTEENLRDRFIGRVVRQDLWDAMWSLDDDEPEQEQEHQVSA